MAVNSFQILPAQPCDFHEILALQNQNHLSNVPENELASGFVTTQLTLESLEKMRENGGVWIARANNENGDLAAYACANDWPFYGDGEFQKLVRKLFPLTFDGRVVSFENSFQYGPVCVATDFRGRGLLPRIVGAIKTYYAPRFGFGITFIDARNVRSLAAHERKLGFREIALLPFDIVTYHMFAFYTAP